MTIPGAPDTHVRLAAEWEPHAATWLAWPDKPNYWPDLAKVQSEFVRFCYAIYGKLRRSEPIPETEERLCILVADAERSTAQRQLQGLPIRWFTIPYGDIWLRDTGPLFVQSAEALRAACFRFNGWGGKYLYPHDSEVGPKIAAALETPIFSVDLTTEGGAIETNGQGCALLTEESLLHENRNEGATRSHVESVLSDSFDLDTFIWIKRGLLGDHTDGHVDNVARFVAPEVIACAEPAMSDEPQRERLLEVLETLRTARSQTGKELELVVLPSAGRVEDDFEGLLPANYLNFYVSNKTVSVPVFGSSQDAQALKKIEMCFPSREIVPVPARQLLRGGGALHCISQPQPTVTR